MRASVCVRRIVGGVTTLKSLQPLLQHPVRPFLLWPISVDAAVVVVVVVVVVFVIAVSVVAVSVVFRNCNEFATAAP